MLRTKLAGEAALAAASKALGRKTGRNGSRLLNLTHRHGNHHILAGMVAGMIGGAVGSWTMERFQAAWSKVSARLSQHPQGESKDSGEQHYGDGAEQEAATVKVAAVLSQRVLHRELSPRAKRYAGPAVHYGFGTSMGGLYGALAAAAPKVTSGAGLPFGAALWLGADETAMPALGLTEPPARYPASTHLYALASHLVYGLTTEMVRRAVLRAWDRMTR